MRIVDETGNALTSIILLLSPREAKELSDKLKNLESKHGEHIHIEDDTFSREITMAIYTQDNKKYFSENIIRIIDTED